MKAIGIICEYNPPHKGHAWQLSVLAAETPAAVRICVMSDAFVQRGEPAVLDPYARAEAALRCGADLVLSLPYPYCCAPAELFARGGISILKALYADGICFGTEGEVLPQLQQIADRLDGETFSREMAAARGDKRHAAVGYPALRDRIYTALYGEKEAALLRTPNNTLGVEYLRACHALGAELSPIAIPRVGAAHDAVAPGAGYASASAIRGMLAAGKTEEAFSHIPADAAAILGRELENGHGLREDAPAGALLLWHYRSTSPNSLSACAGLGGGLAARFCYAAREAVDTEGFLGRIRTKTYTDAALRRAMWNGFFGVTEKQLQTPPPYTLLLAASARGIAYLHSIRPQLKDSGFTVLTRPSSYKKAAPPVQDAFLCSLRAWGVREMLCKKPRAEAELLRRGPVIDMEFHE